MVLVLSNCGWGSRGDKRMIEVEIIIESKCVSPWQACA